MAFKAVKRIFACKRDDYFPVPDDDPCSIHDDPYTSIARIPIEDNVRSEMYWGSRFVSTARSFLGTPYEFGGGHTTKPVTDPKTLDCSALIRYVVSVRHALYDDKQMRLACRHQLVYLRGLIKEGRTTEIKFAPGTFDPDKLKSGDIIFWWLKRTPVGVPAHVGFYYGKQNGEHLIIDASPSGGVSIRPLKGWMVEPGRVLGVIRVLYKDKQK